MFLKYKVGNLLDAKERYIAHGCNELGVMGAGVAKAIADRYPEAYDAYMEDIGSTLLLGDAQFVDLEDGRFIVNMITQKGVGGTRAVNYGAVALSLNHLYRFVSECDHGIFGIAMPKIGAGLGGGDWTVIEEMIEMYALEYQIPTTIYVLDALDIPEWRR